MTDERGDPDDLGTGGAGRPGVAPDANEVAGRGGAAADSPGDVTPPASHAHARAPVEPEVPPAAADVPEKSGAEAERGGDGEKSGKTGLKRPGAAGWRERAGRRGRGTRPRHPERPCLNCGDPTPGDYCPSCGQKKVDVQVSVRAMVMDVIEDDFLIDKRLPRTLFGLFFKPGFLTVEYVNGRIARYVRPFRLYLVSSVIFFLLVSFFSLRMIQRTNFGGDGAEAVPVEEADVEALDSQIEAIRGALAEESMPAAAREPLAEELRRLAARRAAAVEASGEAAGGGDTEQLAEAAEPAGAAEPDSAPVSPDSPADAAGADAPTATSAASERPAGANRPRTVAEMFNMEDASGVIVSSTGIAAVDSAVVQRVRRLSNMTPRQAIETLADDFLSYVPTMMFLLLPVFALMLKLLYIRSRRFYAEHFVFLLHTHAFVYLTFSLMLLGRGVVSLPGWLIPLLLSWAAVYIFLAMKRVYAQGWIKTFVKCSLLGWAYSLIISISIPIGFLLAFVFI